MACLQAAAKNACFSVNPQVGVAQERLSAWTGLDPDEVPVQSAGSLQRALASEESQPPPATAPVNSSTSGPGKSTVSVIKELKLFYGFAARQAVGSEHFTLPPSSKFKATETPRQEAKHFIASPSEPAMKSTTAACEGERP